MTIIVRGTDRVIAEAARDGYAIILLDTESEYTQINEPTEDATMLAALAYRGQEPAGGACYRAGRSRPQV